MATKKQRGSIETSSALELKLETAASTIEGVSLQSEKAIKLRVNRNKAYDAYISSREELKALNKKADEQPDHNRTLAIF